MFSLFWCVKIIMLTLLLGLIKQIHNNNTLFSSIKLLFKNVDSCFNNIYKQRMKQLLRINVPNPFRHNSFSNNILKDPLHLISFLCKLFISFLIGNFFIYKFVLKTHTKRYVVHEARFVLTLGTIVRSF